MDWQSGERLAASSVRNASSAGISGFSGWVLGAVEREVLPAAFGHPAADHPTGYHFMKNPEATAAHFLVFFKISSSGTFILARVASPLLRAMGSASNLMFFFWIMS